MYIKIGQNSYNTEEIKSVRRTYSSIIELKLRDGSSELESCGSSTAAAETLDRVIAAMNEGCKSTETSNDALIERINALELEVALLRKVILK